MSAGSPTASANTSGCCDASAFNVASVCSLDHTVPTRPSERERSVCARERERVCVREAGGGCRTAAPGSRRSTPRRSLVRGAAAATVHPWPHADALRATVGRPCLPLAPPAWGSSMLVRRLKPNPPAAPSHACTSHYATPRGLYRASAAPSPSCGGEGMWTRVWRPRPDATHTGCMECGVTTGGVVSGEGGRRAYAGGVASNVEDQRFLERLGHCRGGGGLSGGSHEQVLDASTCEAH
jgi:hypothetical protein